MELKELRERLDAVVTQLNELEKELAGYFARMAEREKSLTEELAKISHTLFGNGRNGLHTEVRLLTQQLKTRDTVEGENTRGRWLAISAGITSLVTLLVTLLHMWSGRP